MSDRLTFFGTAINKRPEQLAGRLYRIAKTRVLPRLPVNIDERYENQCPSEFQVNHSPILENTNKLRGATKNERDEYRYRLKKAAAGELTFHNDTVSFESGDNIDLTAPQVTQQPIHWRIKCFGFEHMKWGWLAYDTPHEIPESLLQTQRGWLREWIDGHEIAGDTGYMRKDWTPHAVSLRICNWCRFAAWAADRLDPKFREEIHRFLWKNTAFLADNVEYDVGGNHFVENAIALLISGVYFDQQDWIRQSRSLLQRCVDEQLLDDGGHFERSPMYHLIVSQRLLTAVDLLTHSPVDSTRVLTGALKSVSFLDGLAPPDNQIPLLNDSVFNEALSVGAYRRYAASILGENDGSSASQDTMPETGYYWLGDGESKLLAVGGPITVSHLPAHGHAHLATICLWINGDRVITDTGVYEYAAGKRREQSRSVCGHNTVQVDHREPFKFAAEFLGYRLVSPETKYSVASGESELNVAYSVGGIARSSYRHERQIRHENNCWEIIDTIEGVEEEAVSRFHLHPSFTVNQEGNQITVVDQTDEPVLTVNVTGADSINLAESPYYPRYGHEEVRSAIEARRFADGEIVVTFSIPE